MTDQTQTTTEPVLLPCPFCGGEAEKTVAMGESWVRCMTCNAATEMFGTDTAAIAAWNTRTTPQPLAIGLDMEVCARLTKRIAEIDAHVARYPNSLDRNPATHASDLRAILALAAPAEGWQGIETERDNG